MSELDDAKKLIRPITFNTLTNIIQSYEIALNYTFIRTETKKNIETLNKRINNIEKYLEASQKFDVDSFLLELGLSFTISIAATLGAKKLFGSLDKTPFEKFNPSQLYMTDSTVGIAKVGFFRIGHNIGGSDVKPLAYLSDQNFTVLAKRFNKLVDVGNNKNSLKSVVSEAAYDATMSTTFATTQGYVHHKRKTEYSKITSRIIDLNQLHKKFSDSIIDNWNRLQNSLQKTDNYSLLYVINKGLQEYQSLWNKKPKGLKHEFQSSVEKMVSKYFNHAIYVGLSGAIGGTLTRDYPPYRQKTYGVKSSKNLFRTMNETDRKEYSTSLLNNIGKKAGASLIVGMNCKMFNVPNFSRGSSWGQGTVFLVGFDYVLCHIVDRNSFILAIRLTRFKIAGNNKDLSRKNWTAIPPVKKLKYDLKRFPNCHNFKKYIALKSYKKESYLIDLNKHLTGKLKHQNFDQDLILNYMSEKTKRVTEKELKDIPKFNSNSTYVDLSLVKL